jgi:hypothetical protein
LALPPSIKTLVLSLNSILDVQHWDPNSGARVLEQFLKNFAGSRRPALREMELLFSMSLRSLPKFITIPNTLLEVDRLLSSQNLFPSFQKFRITAVIFLWLDGFRRESSTLETLKEDFEKEVGRWFPSLSETGCMVVEWNMFE